MPLPKSAEFVSGEGVPVDGEYAVFPICSQSSERKLIFIGTAFFIAPDGIFATAKHVLMNGSAPIQPLFAIQFLEDHQYLVRSIFQINVDNEADVAIGALAPMVKSSTGESLRNKVLVLTDRHPSQGEIAATFAYPKTAVRDGAEAQELHINSTWHFGHVNEFHPGGRDKVLLPRACFRTSIRLLGGASGGPVTDQYGRVFGINSTGYEGDEISYVSSIVDIWRCRLINVKLADGTDRPEITIAELAQLGLVVVNKERLTNQKS